jgi:hypothetical protein
LEIYGRTVGNGKGAVPPKGLFLHNTLYSSCGRCINVETWLEFIYLRNLIKAGGRRIKK